MSQFPANDRNLPVVEDDEAVVRAQDTVTIPVMDNDSMADGIPLVLDPASVKVIDGAGDAFASGNVVRFVPKDRNPTVPADGDGRVRRLPDRRPAEGHHRPVTVTVMPLPSAGAPNQAAGRPAASPPASRPVTRSPSRCPPRASTPTVTA